jgi:protein-S-isoprenylcysteine O-methyltransferase Ste14
MLSLDICLRVLTIFFFGLQGAYWWITERKANRAKPKIHPRTTRGVIELWIYRCMCGLLAIQLIGVKILAFPHNNIIQILGFMLVVVGILISVAARHEIGLSWTHAVEYQIKKNHELITTGIYQYIRHPIYLGILLSFVGGELVSESYLAIFFFFVLLFIAYKIGKREETILLNHFGKQYAVYMSKTKMIIPYFL